MLDVGPSRLAIAQPFMQWSGDRNAKTVVAFLMKAAEATATVCVFPELVVPGYHRRIREFAQPELVSAWIGVVRAACARIGVGAILGAPTFGSEGDVFNSTLFIGADGCLLGTVDKTGLTDSEKTFFAVGARRPLVACFGHRCSAVMCREVEDFDIVCDALAPGRPTLLFWPGLMRPEDGKEDEDPTQDVRHAQAIARRLKTYIVQANWPNSLNDPRRDAIGGGSVVISPDGEIELALPRGRSGLGAFELGGRSLAWSPA